MEFNWDPYLDETRLRSSTVSSKRIENKDYRNEYESDLSRVVFSSATRRMHDKTQVIPLTTDDNIHSRLTHSMEVMTIGESLIKGVLAEMYGLDSPVFNKYYARLLGLVRTICFAHDIGNPPFGHFGESAISDYFGDLFGDGKRCKWDNYDEWKIDFTQFNGNAQGFRVLSKLQCLNDLYGLNLTKASLASYLKYPNWGPKVKKSYIGTTKHGVCCADQAFAEDVLGNTGCSYEKEGKKHYKRHPLSFIMEAADTICYLSMDVEDAFEKGWINIEQLFLLFESKVGDKVPNKENFLKVLFIFKDQEEGGQLSLLDRLQKEGHDKIVYFRVGLIQYFMTLAINNFISNISLIESGEYGKEIVFDDKLEVANLLLNFSQSFIYSQKEIMQLEVTGKTVITGLIRILSEYLFHTNEGFRNRGKSLLSRSILRANLIDYKVLNREWSYDKERKLYICEKGDVQLEEELTKLDIGSFPNYFKYRVIVDYVSGMTDKYALSLYQKLSGLSL